MSVLATVETDPESEDVIATAYELAVGFGTDLVVVHIADIGEEQEKSSRGTRH